MQDAQRSPLVVASKSPFASPSLGPLDEPLQAVPIDEVTFELLEESDVGGGLASPVCDGVERRPCEDGGYGGEMFAQAKANVGRDEPAYVVPATPSPFLHSAFPPSVVPPFSYSSGLYDLGLPPAYGTDCEVPVGQYTDDGQYMQGLGFLPEIPDSSYGWPGAWMTQGHHDTGGYMQACEGKDPAAMHCGRDGDLWEEDVSGMGLDAPEAFNSGRPGRKAEGGPSSSGDAGAGAPKATSSGTGSMTLAAAAAALVQGKATPAREGKGKGKSKDEREDTRGDRRKGGEKGGDRTATDWGLAEKPDDKRNEAGQGGAAGDQEAIGNYTTVMLRNIPNKYTREMLVKQLNVEFNGQFDFMYLPIDFRNKCNVGYGFINFRTPEVCESFVSKFHGVDVRKCLPGLNSKKIVEVTPARVQGRSENVRRLRNSPVMNQLQEHPEWMPLLFDKDGYEEIFPLPDQLPLPPVKPRGRNRKDEW